MALRVLPLALIVTAVAGCSTITSSRTGQIMHAYVGQRLSEIAAHYGPPNSNFHQTDNGELTFQWDNFRADQTLDAAGAAPPPRAINCRLWVSALPDDAGSPPGALGLWVVQSTQSFGGDCY